MRSEGGKVTDSAGAGAERAGARAADRNEKPQFIQLARYWYDQLTSGLARSRLDP
jgi:hypothetical protein